MKLRLGDPSASDLLNTNKQGAWGDASHQRWLRELENARVKLLEGTKVVKAADGEQSGSKVSSPIQDNSRANRTDLTWPGQIATSPSAVNHESVSNFVNIGPSDPISVAAATNYPIGVAEEGVILERLVTPMGEESETRDNKNACADKARNQDARTGERWSPENLHLTTDENGVVVWLRDASVGNETLTRLADSLRKNLAESGVRLSQIYLNGHPVVLGLAHTK